MKHHIRNLITFMAVAISTIAYSGEVSLDHALAKKTPQRPGAYCPFCVSFTGAVEVENIAYEKEITVHYAVNGGASWVPAEAQFTKMLSDEREIWHFYGNTGYLFNGVAEIEFVIEYEVNGKTYWDNNNGENYFLTVENNISDQIIDEKNVFAQNHRIVYDSFKGEVYLRNLAYDKEINIIYTYDNWETTLVGFTNFKQTSFNPEYELWTFDIDVPLGTEGIEFAVAYDVNGTTYWANNFGDNYFATQSSF